MSETIVLGGKRFIGVQPWFDLECKQAKFQAKHALRMFRLKHTEECKTVYLESRLKYKTMLRNKTELLKKSLKEKLLSNMYDAKAFWSSIRKISKKKRTDVVIPAEDWLQHFQSVFEATREPHPLRPMVPDMHDGTSEDHQLNSVIQEQEVYKTP